MEIINHRCNTKEKLIATPKEYGIEIDIRSVGEKLILHHEPHMIGEYFEDWIKYFNHGTLILNIKEEGLEPAICDLMKQNNIEKFFFLDQSFPFLIKTVKSGESRTAIRISEFESINTALTLAGLVDWVWIDYFTKLPIDKEQSLILKRAGFKICLVSPELQNHSTLKMQTTKDHLKDNQIIYDAVCTKFPESWLS